MYGELSTVALDTYGVLRARGQDIVSFLQGQLSNDIARLAPERSLLAGYHNPQGRVIALLRVLQLAADDLLCVLPRELIGPVSARLSKFILRAKAKLADESQLWRVGGLLPLTQQAGAAAAARPAALPAAANAAARIAQALVVRLSGEPARWLLVSPAAAAALPGYHAAPEPLLWQRLAIAAGEPQVYTATSEEFVAQMINLDCLGAIDFDKGCYTGQEVIARAHYRGRVKRRMQRFVTSAPRHLKPGDAGELQDGRAFRVVDAVALADGRCEFLAVAPLEPGETEAAVAAGSSRAAAARLDVQALTLPYPLPGSG